MNPIPTSAKIYFYFPHAVIKDIPEVDGTYVPKRAGQYIWTVKTFGMLQSHGFNCAITNVIPDAGVIIAHRDFFPDHLKPNAQQLFVCAVADTYRHPFAQIHLLQNARDPLLRKPSVRWPSAFMPHWTETGLRARDPARGARLTNIAYFGLASRLAPQLCNPSFKEKMQAHGFQFTIVGVDKWYDYSDVDAVLAVRSFAAVPYAKHPPTKLYNAWCAGVPALLGSESAFQAERRSDYDYFEVNSVDQIIATLERLKNEPGLRTAMTANAIERAKQVSPESTVKHWIAFCEDIAAPALDEWKAKSHRQRQYYFMLRAVSYRWFIVRDFFYRGAMLLKKRVAARTT